MAIFGDIGQYHKSATLLINTIFPSRHLFALLNQFRWRIFTIIISVANHQSVLPIFCLTVVTLDPPGSTHVLSSAIVIIPCQQPRRRLELASPRFFTITSVANHQRVLPICFLTLVSLCIFLNVRHCPLPTVTFKFLLSQIHPSMFAHRRLESASL